MDYDWCDGLCEDCIVYHGPAGESRANARRRNRVVNFGYFIVSSPQGDYQQPGLAGCISYYSGRKFQGNRKRMNESITLQRLYQQGLAYHPFGSPTEVVAWLGAVQAQDYPGAKWALGLRLGPEGSDGLVEQALTDGAILRTHIMRPTWHFVSVDDARMFTVCNLPGFAIPSCIR